MKTPQPVVIKLMTARCMRDKLGKGDFIIRAGVLDRLVDNKLYYKFVEYGERVKEQKMVDEEKEKRAKSRKDMMDLSVLLSQHDDDVHDEVDLDKELEDDEEAYQEMMAKPLFAADDDAADEQSLVSKDKEEKKKGVTWGADVE